MITERHHAGLAAVAHRDTIGVLAALRPDDLRDFLVDQLGQHAKPDAHAQRQQPLLRGADQLAQRLLHARRQAALQRLLSGRDLRDRYGPLHGGSSFGLERIAIKFYELRDNLSTGGVST